MSKRFKGIVQFKTICNVEVRAEEDYNLEKMIKRFSKKVKKDGILKEVFDRKFFKKDSEINHLKDIRRKKVTKSLEEKRKESLNRESNR